MSDTFPHRNFRNDAMDQLARDIYWWQDRMEFCAKRGNEIDLHGRWFRSLRLWYWYLQYKHAKNIERKLIRMYNELADAKDI